MSRRGELILIIIKTKNEQRIIKKNKKVIIKIRKHNWKKCKMNTLPHSPLVLDNKLKFFFFQKKI